MRKGIKIAAVVSLLVLNFIITGLVFAGEQGHYRPCL